VEDVATPQAFRRNPALVQQFYDQRRAFLGQVVPNAAHLALARLEAECARLLAAPELRARLAPAGLTPGRLTGDAAHAFVQREAAIWAEVVRASGATAD
jgi:tripartite-type tricarboxylate transporter receptor subunit TctC